jgi:hypothetical protein
MSGKVRQESEDRAIGRVAEGQHGVITRAQLSELGLSRDAIDYRLGLGRLRHMYRGVYALVGPRLLTQHGRWMAAVLACGPGAALSYSGATGLWQIRRGKRLEVTVPRGRKARKGIQIHWVDLPDDEVTIHHGIPVTTVPRTLLDISAVVQHAEFRSALRQAEQLRLTDRLWLGELIKRHPRQPGRARGRPAPPALAQSSVRVSASGPISPTEGQPARPIVRSKSAMKLVTTSRTPASPASASP